MTGDGRKHALRILLPTLKADELGKDEKEGTPGFVYSVVSTGKSAMDPKTKPVAYVLEGAAARERYCEILRDIKEQACKIHRMESAFNDWAETHGVIDGADEAFIEAMEKEASR